MRRARIGMGLTAFKDYQMYVEGEFINGAATGITTQTAALTNGWLEALWFQPAKIRLGQFKPLFGLENSMPDVLTDFQERALTQSIEEVLLSLREREAKILRLYFGLDSPEPMTLEEIGAKLGITRERVRQIKEKALSRLRHVSRSKALESFLF